MLRVVPGLLGDGGLPIVPARLRRCLEKRKNKVRHETRPCKFVFLTLEF